MSVARLREKVVEADHRKHVKANGGLSRKFVSPGVRGVPDRIDLHGIEPMVPILRRLLEDELMGTGCGEGGLRAACRRLLAAGITFTECKRPGETPTPSQQREHARYRALGFTVNVVDSLQKDTPDGNQDQD